MRRSCRGMSGLKRQVWIASSCRCSPFVKGAAQSRGNRSVARLRGGLPAFCRGANILRTRASVEERAQSDDRRIRTGPGATGDRISKPIELCKRRSYLRFRIHYKCGLFLSPLTDGYGGAP